MNRSATNALRVVGCAAAAGAVCLTAVGCGGDEALPANAVVKVGDTVVTKAQFDHWYATSAKAQSQGQTAPPDPPTFAKCVASLKRAQSKSPGKPPKDSALKEQCKTSYDQLKQQTMQFLIQAQWVQQEAEEQDVEVTGAEVRQMFDEQKKQAFPKERDYRKFLRTSGSTEQDILFRVKLDALQGKLAEKAQEDQDEVTDEDVREYYESHQGRYSKPERRDLNIVLARTKAEAQQAKRELEAGASFATVAKRHSIDRTTRAKGGRYPGVAQGQEEERFDTAIFAARKGKIEGPVETQFGWYVFEVAKVKLATETSLEEASAEIRTTLESQNQQKAMTDYTEDFRESHRADTECAEDFLVPECENGPDQATDTSATPTGP